MFAYSRGSHHLAGAAPLESRVPANLGPFATNVDIAQRIEQQPPKLSAAGSTPAIRLLLKQLAPQREPGWAPARCAR